MLTDPTLQARQLAALRDGVAHDLGVEALIDELAHAARLTPAAYRRALLPAGGLVPLAYPARGEGHWSSHAAAVPRTGAVFSRVRLQSLCLKESLMNAKLFALVAATASLLPFAAGAQEATTEPAPASSLQSRADVTAELYRARKAGDMKVVRAGYIGEAPQSRTRAEVMAELQRARASGELAAMQAEVVDFAAARQPAEVPRWLARNR